MQLSFLLNLLKHKGKSFCSNFSSTNPVIKLCVKHGQFEEAKTLMKCDLRSCPLKGTTLCAVSEGHSRSNVELKAFSKACLPALSCNSIKQHLEREIFQVSVKY